MFSKIVLLMLLMQAPAATVSSPGEDWTPFRAFVGTWKGARTTSSGTVSITRDYESVVGNQHLLVTDQVASSRAPWGMVSFDDAKHGFVLRRFDVDGSVAELALEDVSQDGARLVFSGPQGHGAPGQQLITHERHGWDEYVERVEVAVAGQPTSLVSETRFRRKH